MERPTTALVVDANDQIRVLLTAFLSRCGFAVESAADLDSALAKLRRFEFDVLLLDPACVRDGSGMSRVASQFPEIVGRTVIIAAPPHRTVTERVHAVLDKPFELEAILSAARACSRSRNLHQT